MTAAAIFAAVLAGWKLCRQWDRLVALGRKLLGSLDYSVSYHRVTKGRRHETTIDLHLKRRD